MTDRRAFLTAALAAPIAIAAPAVVQAAEVEATPALPAAVTDALIKALRASHVQMFVYDGELHTAFPEPGVAGRPERGDFLDDIDGAQRALYRLMCAIPGAIEAVRDSITSSPLASVVE